ncbi:hypothetical protein [Bacillus mycoides]|uniref:hypothetical protein n=1 Tax=Bacillus mycoides TaxID=1405 RepID=UPI001C33FBAA|nr:hypothetical protein EXW59_32285 [Bacillus mycoides]QWI46234.1 hypothetical protein EXW55_25795 [Bacillus mycoides]
MKPPTILAAEAGLNKKCKRLVQNRRTLQTPDEEALFASQEEAKPPTILAAGTGLNKSRNALSILP